jgi:hypothetical protein
VTGRRLKCTAGAEKQGIYYIRPIHLNIKSAPAKSGRSRVGPALYVFSLLEHDYALKRGEGTGDRARGVGE